MTTVLTWLLPFAGSALGNLLARFFSGSCPLEPQTFVCAHWVDIATVAGAVLGAFGFQVTVQKKAAARVASKPTLEVQAPTEPEADPQAVDESAPIDFDPHSGP